VPLNDKLVGKTYEKRTFAVTVEAIERYARATNDENPAYLKGDDSVGSPVFVVVPAFDSFMAASTDPELGADLLRLVHGEEEHILHRSVVPGDVLTVTPVLESVELKETGETFTVGARLNDAAGELVAEVRGTMFIRGSGSRRAAVEAARAQRGGPGEHPIVYEEKTAVDPDQPARYAEASGDHNPIHLDAETAKLAGFPGVIAHGMCTLAIATKAAVNGPAGGDPTRVRRVRARFSKAVIPGQDLTTRLWRESDVEGVSTYGFETHNQEGAAVVRGGSVDVVP